MVKDVRYVTLTSCYRDLQAMLVTGQLKTMALVESRGKWIQIEVYLRKPRLDMSAATSPISGLGLLLF